MGDTAVWSVFGADDDQIADLLGMNLVPAGAGEAEMARVHDLDVAKRAILAPQRPRVGPEDLVLEVAGRFGGGVAGEKLHVIDLFVGRDGSDAALRVGQRVIVDRQPAQRDVGAAGKGDRACRLSANHLHAIGYDLDVFQSSQQQVLPIPRRHTIPSGRHNDALGSRFDFLVEEALQVEGRTGNGSAALSANRDFCGRSLTQPQQASQEQTCRVRERDIHEGLWG